MVEVCSKSPNSFTTFEDPVFCRMPTCSSRFTLCTLQQSVLLSELCQI